jgi:hypothetical protein
MYQAALALLCTSAIDDSIKPVLNHASSPPAGPFSLPVQCLARSGCLVSNVLTSGNTLNVSASINAVS